jgi:hypothetical protein
MRSRSDIRLLTTLFAAAVLWSAPLALSAAQTQTAQTAQTKQLPTALSDSAFWNIISTFSENEQPFTTYLVSNETFYPDLVRQLLVANVRPGAYIGVAPEQNYHYIAALRPRIAFVLDIRRQAVMQHLMFKSVFELSADRADFISLLFSKPRPDGIAANATAYQTYTAFWHIPTDTTRFWPNFMRIFNHLKVTHRFPLSANDSLLLHFTYSAFYVAGPNLVSNGSSSNEGSASTFANLTSASDVTGTERSFLANEDGYQAVRQLHRNNLIIPVVGDFAGSHALRSIGNFLREHNVQLAAFYVSNVETYLNRDGRSGAFYGNVATIPYNETSVMVRGIRPGSLCNIVALLASRC